MNIGISGTRGFIGSCVAKTLKSKKHGVLSLDPYTEKLLLNDEKFPNDLDWVLHFAAKTKITESFDSTYAFYVNNINSTLCALEIAGCSNASFLYMSSYVYGSPAYVPIDEAHPTRAINPYMGSKLIGEQISLHICQFESIPLIILRGFNIYGPGLPSGRLVSDLLQSVQTGKQLTVNDPIPRRDYLYIDDFCALIIKIIKEAVEIIRITSGQLFSKRRGGEPLDGTMRFYIFMSPLTYGRLQIKKESLLRRFFPNRSHSFPESFSL